MCIKLQRLMWVALLLTCLAKHVSADYFFAVTGAACHQFEVTLQGAVTCSATGYCKQCRDVWIVTARAWALNCSIPVFLDAQSTGTASMIDANATVWVDPFLKHYADSSCSCDYGCV